MSEVSVEEYRRRKQLWVHALRGGEYQQGRKCLKRVTPEGDQHCCLGVACEVFAGDGYDIERLLLGNEVFFDYRSAFLPERVQKWLGLKTRDGRSDTLYALFELHDSGNKTFREIADIIDSEPEGLFTWSSKEAHTCSE